MQLRRKIISHTLLVTYLLVTLLSMGQHNHTDEIMGSVAHKHEDFKEVHHEHDFHVGIFHLFGHLFEHIIHADDSDEQNIAFLIPTSSSKKDIQQKSTISCYFQIDNFRVFVVDAESLPAPPFYLSFLQKIKQPNTPLRAPPSLV